MRITLFAKTAHTKDGKPFTRYIGKMDKKDGSQITVTCRATDKAKDLKSLTYPAIIEFDKKDANLASQTYTRKDGTEGTSYTLWLNKWAESSEKYVDHSLDDFA